MLFPEAELQPDSNTTRCRQRILLI